MLSQVTIDNWLKNLYNILVDVNISLNNAKKLKREDDKNIESIKKEPYFQHQWYHLRFIMIIQLAKLYQKSGTQKITFRKLLNRLSNDSFDPLFEAKLKNNSSIGEDNLFKTKDDILRTKDEVFQLLDTFSELIYKLENSRNRVFAHTDPDIKVEYLKLEELDKLTKLGNIIFNKINGRINNVNTLFEITTPWSIDIILTDMARARALRN